MLSNLIEVPENEVEQFYFNMPDGIGVLMDCGGSNAVKIHEQLLMPQSEAGKRKSIVRWVGTSRVVHPEVRARQRAEEFGVSPPVEFDFREYENKYGIYPGDYFKALKPGLHSGIKSEHSPEKIIQIRNDICKRFMDMIYERMEKDKILKNIPVFAAGFMALLSEEFVNNFFILNVHPGDLTKYELAGERHIFRGKRAVVGDAWIPPAKAISAGYEELYSSMHVMTPEMDTGPVLMRGYPLPIDYNYLLSRVDIRDEKILRKVGSAAQEALKHLGDHVIAGASFLDLFVGNWGKHKSGTLAYCIDGRWYLAPNGITPEHHIKNHHYSQFARKKRFIDDKIAEFYQAVDEISRAA